MSLRPYPVTLILITLLFTCSLVARAAEPQPKPGRRTLPLSLEQAVALALQNNYDLQIARRNMSNAASAYRAAQAGYYPSLRGSLSSSHGLANSPSDTVATNVITSYIAGFNVSVTMPLDLSGAIGRTVQQALITLITQKATYILNSQTLVTSVYDQYYSVLRAKETINIDRGQAEQAQEQLRIAEARLKAGRVAEVDVLSARVQMDNARQNLKIDEGAYDIALSILRNTLVVDQQVEVMPTGRLTFKPQTFKYEPSLKEALENRLEIKSAKLSLESARIALKSTYDPYLPTLSANAAWGYNISGNHPLDSWQNRPKEPGYSAGAIINVPIFIFDGGVIKENKVQALNNIDQAQTVLAQTKSNIELEVKNNLITLENSQDRVKMGESSVGLAQESLRIAELRYRMGLNTYLEVTDTRSNLKTAQLNYLGALISFNLGKITFYRTLGRPLVTAPLPGTEPPVPSLKENGGSGAEKTGKPGF